MCFLPLKSVLISRDDCHPPYNSVKKLLLKFQPTKRNTMMMAHAMIRSSDLFKPQQHEEGDGGEAASYPLVERHCAVTVIVYLAHHVGQDLEHYKSVQDLQVLSAYVSQD